MGKKKPATNTTGTATATPATTPATGLVAPAAPAPVTHPDPAPKRSYRDLDPLEEGGRVNQKGIAYQHHVTSGKCLDMLLADGPSEVWCEAEDDIVLVWVIQGVEWFEFVQVKSDELKQLWSLAKLWEREAAKDGKGPGACIIEKSLAHDRGDGNCRFRVVTCREPHSDIAVLKLALGTTARTDKDSGLEDVVKAVEAKLGGCRSANGNGVGFWVRMTVWECKASIRDMENENLVKLDQILHAENVFLAPDQKQELYAKLTQKVFDASLPSGKTHREQKRIKVADLRTWLLEQAGRAASPASAGRSDVLEGKLTDAGYMLNTSEIETAKEQRQKYRMEVLQPRFLDVSDRAVVEMEVQARLCRLKAQLDAGEFSDNGMQFHSRCLKELESLSETIGTNKKPLVGLLYGLMYEIMNRCPHRLVRVSA
ncbi:MAG: dsDNA nuclease domain-containing protein [Gemmataceae bacterium]